MTETLDAQAPPETMLHRLVNEIGYMVGVAVVAFIITEGLTNKPENVVDDLPMGGVVGGAALLAGIYRATRGRQQE